MSGTFNMYVLPSVYIPTKLLNKSLETFFRDEFLCWLKTFLHSIAYQCKPQTLFFTMTHETNVSERESYKFQYLYSPTSHV